MASPVLKIITIAFLTQSTLTQRFGHRQSRPQFKQQFQPPPFQQPFSPQYQQPYYPGSDYQQPFRPNFKQSFQPGDHRSFQPGFQQPFQPGFQQQLPSEVNEQFHPNIQQTFPCQSVTFINRTEDGWHGRLTVKPSKDSANARIELSFDESVTALVNNFGHSSSKNSQDFIIEASDKNLISGRDVEVDFFVKSPGGSNLPIISSIKLNDEAICPEDDPSPEDTNCAKFEMVGNGTGGRWDGILTIFPHHRRKSIQIDIEMDSPIWALGNDLGETKTFNQKTFLIRSQRPVQPGLKLPINFFVKFDELGAIPAIRSVYIDGVRTCITGELNRPSSDDSSGDFTTEVPNVNGIRLTDLMFNQFPSVTAIPAQVNNMNFECGAAGNGLRNRFTGGVSAEVGEFPFHVAAFRDQLYRCGGSLISSTTVVTAGHCVVEDNREVMEKDRFRLLFGSIDLKTLTGTEALREVAEIIKHPDYEYDQILKQDIALMILKGNLQFTPSISPICLFDTQEPITNHLNQRFTVLGFGSSETSREPSRYLNHGKMSIITRQQCIESKLIFGLLPELSAFCAKAVDKMVACPGDSGGGLIFNNNGKYYLRGISSVSITEFNQQCDAKQAVAFTDVSFFLTWIRQNMRNITI